MNCKMCSQPEEAHKKLRHPFTPEGTDVNTDFLKKKEEPSIGLPDNTSGPVINSSHLPFDPVVRTALINKGILTMQDLEEAEAFIKAVGGVLHGNQEPV